MSDDFAPSTDELLARNAEFADAFDDADLPGAPARALAVVACMDCRIDVHRILGLENGDAHIIRNGGGVVSDDVIRSLCLSQRSLGTREIILVHHTDCGLQKTDAMAFTAELEAELGVKPTWSVESFRDPYEDTRQSMARIRLSPFVAHDEHLRGFVYDVADGRLHEVV